MRSAPDSSFSTSIATAEGEGERERENSRPLLADMKVMVLQGESLLSTDGAGAVEGEEGLHMAPTSTRSTVSSRELSKAQTVVEVAEEVRLSVVGHHESCVMRSHETFLFSFTFISRSGCLESGKRWPSLQSCI